ncbi:MAG: hypothetical protein ACXVYV_05285, partial [Gaiellales bacterium]
TGAFALGVECLAAGALSGRDLVARLGAALLVCSALGAAAGVTRTWRLRHHAGGPAGDTT